MNEGSFLYCDKRRPATCYLLVFPWVKHHIWTWYLHEALWTYENLGSRLMRHKHWGQCLPLAKLKTQLEYMSVKVVLARIECYSCLFFYLEPPNLLPLSFGQEVMDAGASAQVLCIVTKGDLPLNIAWSFHGSNITSDLGISTMPTGPLGSLLMIPSVGHKHRGTYTCKASNLAGVRTQSVELKVNGKGSIKTPGGHWNILVFILKWILLESNSKSF